MMHHMSAPEPDEGDPIPDPGPDSEPGPDPEPGPDEV